MTKRSGALACGLLLAAFLPATQAVAQTPNGKITDPQGPNYAAGLDSALAAESIRHSEVYRYLDSMQRVDDAAIEAEELKCRGNAACVIALGKRERQEHDDLEAQRMHENAVHANLIAQITAYYRTHKSYGTRREL
jgi:hypothetical protein